MSNTDEEHHRSFSSDNNEEEMNSQDEADHQTDNQDQTTDNTGQFVVVLQKYSPIACKNCRSGHRQCDKALPVSMMTFTFQLPFSVVPIV